MSWQDIVFSIGAWIFVIALLPSVFGKDKPALTSSLMTGSVLAIYALTYLTLSLWISAFSTSLVALTWFTLAVQKYLMNKRKV